MISLRSRVWVLLAAVMVVAACSSGSPSQSTGSTQAPSAASQAPSEQPSASTAATGRFTAEEVLAATGPHQVVQIYAVPKQLKKRYLLAFLNPGRSVPFFVDWSDAMNAAAKFYGVDLVETDLDLKYENTVSSYESIAERHPDVVGTLTTAGTALKAVTDKAGIPVVPLEIAIEGDPYVLGIPNDKAGVFAGKALAEAVAKKLAGDWAGKNVVYIGLGSDNAEVNKRATAALDEIRKTATIDDKNVVYLLCNGQADPCQTATTDALTAHPNDVFLINGINDEAAVGALQAVKSQHRAADVLMVSQGADRAGRDLLRGDTDGVMVGAVDYNPWAEGWSWVEAALAVAEGEGQSFKPYEVNRIITRENVDQAYPGDK